MQLNGCRLIEASNFRGYQAHLEPPLCLTPRWNGPGMLRDLETKLYDVIG